MSDTTTSAAPTTLPTLRRRAGSDLSARGEPYVWMMGAALVIGLGMIISLLAYVFYVGTTTFWPQRVATVTTLDGRMVAGEVFRSENYKVPSGVLESLPAEAREKIAANLGVANRTLYRVGNYDLFGEDFVWVADFEKKSVTFDRAMFFVERLEWGAFIGKVKSIDLAGKVIERPALDTLNAAIRAGAKRRRAVEVIEKGDINDVNHALDELRLEARRAEIDYGTNSPEAICRAREKSVGPQVGRRTLHDIA